MDFRLIKRDNKFYTKIENINKLSKEEQKNMYINICAIRRMLEMDNAELKKIRKKMTKKFDDLEFTKKIVHCDVCNEDSKLYHWSSHVKSKKHIRNLENKAVINK
jgi:hypothetical protein